MNIQQGEGKTKYGPGISIRLTGEEVVMAIYTYLTAHRVHISGPATITVNGELCKKGHIYVDPSGFVVADGERHDGGPNGRGERPGPQDA